MKRTPVEMMTKVVGINGLEVRILVFPRLRRLGHEVFWVGLGQAAGALGGIVGVKMLTHVLPPTAYGELALGMTMAMLVQQTVLVPPIVASLRFFTSSQVSNQLRAYLHGIRQLLAQATVIVLAIVCTLSIGLWVSGHAEWLELAVAALLFALFSSYSAVLDGMQNAARQRVVVAWHDGLAPWLRFTTAVALIGVLGTYSRVAMFGYAVAAVAVLLSQIWFFRRRIFALSAVQPESMPGDIRKWTRQMYAYAWPFAMWCIFTWAQMASDRWALQTFSNTSTVGLYAVLYQLGYYPITILSGFLSQLASPVLFSRAGDGSDPTRLQHSSRLNNRLVLAVVLLTGLGTLLAFLLHSQIFSLLAAPEYREVSEFLPWMVLSGGLFASGQTASLLLMANVNTQNLIAPKITTALLGIVLNVAGAYALGLRGVVFASVLFSCVYCAWILYLAYRLRGEPHLLRGASSCELLSPEL